MFGTRRRPRKPLPAIRCELVEETWGPHDGCAEFMDRPEVWICRIPATHVAKYFDPYLRVNERMRLCEWHSEHGANILGVPARVYRFRRVSK
jgi:hypothetical protein